MSKAVSFGYQRLEASHGEIIWFEGSGHDPNFRKAARFQEVLWRVKVEHGPARQSIPAGSAAALSRRRGTHSAVSKGGGYRRAGVGKEPGKT